MFKNNKQKKLDVINKSNHKIIELVTNWFMTPTSSKETIKIGSNQISINSFAADFLLSVLILSLIINLFWLSSWVLYQVDPVSRDSIINLIF